MFNSADFAVGMDEMSLKLKCHPHGIDWNRLEYAGRGWFRLELAVLGGNRLEMAGIGWNGR